MEDDVAMGIMKTGNTYLFGCITGKNKGIPVYLQGGRSRRAGAVCISAIGGDT